MNSATYRESIQKWPCQNIENLYKILNVIGYGRYGKVYKAIHKLYPEKYVAVKKIKPFGSEGISIISLREIRLLHKLKHQNIIRLLDIVTKKDKNKTIYLIFEFMHHDLAGIYKNNVKLSDQEIKYIIKEILTGVQFIHMKNIIHRDLKAENIFINNTGDVKIGDFGLSKTSNTKKSNTNQKKVVSLWYRAPELLLGVERYHTEIDIWSLGCLFVELMFPGEFLFRGSSEIQVFEKILMICGDNILQTWDESLVLAKAFEKKIKDTSKLFSDQIINGEKFKGGFKSYIKEKFPMVKQETIDFISGFFKLNPKERTTAMQALNHEFFQQKPLPTIFYMKYKINKSCFNHELSKGKTHKIEKKQEMIEKKIEKEYDPSDEAVNKILNIYDPEKNIDIFLERISGNKNKYEFSGENARKKIKN